MHVLLVEDDPRLQRVLRRLLEDDRHVVEVAPDGATAIELADATEGIETVILDVGLPDMSGHDVARRLRQLPALKDAVLVAVTGYGQQSDRRRSREAGFNHHWIKPLTVEMLADLLAALDAGESNRDPQRVPNPPR